MRDARSASPPANAAFSVYTSVMVAWDQNSGDAAKTEAPRAALVTEIDVGLSGRRDLTKRKITRYSRTTETDASTAERMFPRKAKSPTGTTVANTFSRSV